MKNNPRNDDEKELLQDSYGKQCNYGVPGPVLFGYLRDWDRSNRERSEKEQKDFECKFGIKSEVKEKRGMRATKKRFITKHRRADRGKHKIKYWHSIVGTIRGKQWSLSNKKSVVVVKSCKTIKQTNATPCLSYLTWMSREVERQEKKKFTY